jgi:Domain of unknown function (DUF4377)
MKTPTIFAALVALLLLSSCSSSDGASNDESFEETFQINSNKASCTSTFVTLCLMTRANATQPWQLFYSDISGFQFQWGKLYELRVRVTKVSNPPQDAPSLTYSQIALLSAVDVPRTQTFQISVQNVGTAISPGDSASRRFSSTNTSFSCRPEQCARLDQLAAQGSAATLTFDHTNSPAGPLNLVGLN